MFEKIIDIYLNIEYLVTLIDRVYLKKVLSNIQIKKILVSILVRDIENKIIYIDKYIQIKIFVSDNIDNKSTIEFFIMKVYIVDNLKANMLIKINNLKFQNIATNFNTTIAKIEAYKNLTIFINTYIYI